MSTNIFLYLSLSMILKEAEDPARNKFPFTHSAVQEEIESAAVNKCQEK